MMVSTMNNAMAFISMPGTTECLVILFVALLLFGRRLPEVARSMGKSITEFKKGLSDAQRDIETDNEPVRPSSTANLPGSTQQPPSENR